MRKEGKTKVRIPLGDHNSASQTSHFLGVRSISPRVVRRGQPFNEPTQPVVCESREPRGQIVRIARARAVRTGQAGSSVRGVIRKPHRQSPLRHLSELRVGIVAIGHCEPWSACCPRIGLPHVINQAILRVSDSKGEGRMSYLQQTIKAVIRPGDEGGYVAECLEIAVVTQGRTLDETVKHLQEATALHLEGESLATFGLRDTPTLMLTMELDPVHAQAS